jgi:dTMP kinase
MRGSFIVIEGPDGSGKETQTKFLAEKFSERGIPYAVFDFPRYQNSFFGELVGRFLKGEFGGLSDVSPYLASLTYAGDRWQAGPEIRKTLESGTNVISNRYFLSNVAHQTVKLPPEKQDDFIKFLKVLEYEIYQIPKEDLNIILHIPIHICAELIERKKDRAYLDGKKKDIHESDIKYQLAVAELYTRLPSMFPDIRSVTCVREGVLLPPEEIHLELWKEAGKYITRGPEGNGARRERI